MGMFSQWRARKAADRELGQALWRQDNDRFGRAVDRFHQVLHGVDDDALYNALVPLGDRLADLLPTVRQVCVECQAREPVTGDDVPGALEPVHRLLTRASNEAATAAQAAAMARFADSPQDGVTSTQRRVRAVEDRIGEVQAALAARGNGDPGAKMGE